ncbi:hypothetical protein [Streptomyces sp. NBC_00503]|uniref:hypothetical protein n=1 Tax=Streptomyces sp. NBC_00503 TaxID=2903659 RepID=UPI002E816E21|nr:hypothetical protein [Streptomyces sp. NBC_00503]WUD79279.1 hypothetical protein OG490_01075 [Streptomyces sp. NBC_00503]
MGLRRLAATGVAVAMGGALVCGCGPLGADGASGSSASADAAARALIAEASLSFRYVGDSHVDETMNQQLEIKNATRGSVAPVLAFTALDKNHQEMPQVAVTTVYGSDRGGLVVPYGTSWDTLRFSGPGEHDVADVRVTVRSAAAARIPAGMHDVKTQALDSQGHEISRFERFSAVRLTNEDDFPVSVRIAYILWDQPPKGTTQQAVEVTSVGGLTEVPAHGTSVVQVSADAAAAVARNSNGPAVSIKAYNSQ